MTDPNGPLPSIAPLTTGRTGKQKPPIAEVEPSVLGAGAGPSPMPTEADAIAAWRHAFAARLVERGILDQDAATDCSAAADVDLTQTPADAADAEVEYWSTDD